jgi:uncharacterized protein YkwD
LRAPAPVAVRLDPPALPRPPALPKKRGPLVAILAALVLLPALAGGTFYFLRGQSNSTRPGARKETGGKQTSPGDDQPARDGKDKEAELPTPSQPADKLQARVLAAINAQRAGAGLTALVLDKRRSAACRAHARYWLTNAGHPAAKAAGKYAQVPDLEGASDVGRAAARTASVIDREPLAAVKAWLRAPAHRALVLHSALEKVAFGTVRDEEGRWVSVFDWLSGTTGDSGGSREAPRTVLYPANKQTRVPLAYPGNEVPDPVPLAANKLTGYPITLTFAARIRVSSIEASLEDEHGTDLPVWFSSPERPANKNHAGAQQNTVCLMARQRLRPATRYTALVKARVDGRAWSTAWSFTTMSEADFRRDMYGKVLARLNHHRTATGLPEVVMDDDRSGPCLAHSLYLARNVDDHPGLNVNDEGLTLPGYTKEGQEVARRSAVRVGGGPGAEEAVDWLLASLLNRNAVLNPSLHKAGLGAAQQAPRGWIWTMDLSAPRLTKGAPLAVLHPGKNQTGVGLTYGRDVAELVGPEGKDNVAGYAISAAFPPGTPVAGARAELAEASGAKGGVPFWLSSPTPGKSFGTLRYNLIGVLPKEPLRPATTYRVRLSATVNGRAWSESWSFTTIDPERAESEVGAELLRRVNECRKRAGVAPVVLDDAVSRGCRLHARYVALNFNEPAVQGLGVHNEDMRLPGATPEGARAGKGGVIAIIADPIESVEGWMATLYHRVPLLDPRLKRVGYGQAMVHNRGWVTVLDAESGKERGW